MQLGWEIALCLVSWALRAFSRLLKLQVSALLALLFYSKIILNISYMMQNTKTFLHLQVCRGSHS